MPVERITFPVGVFLLEKRNDVGTAPAARLVHVPGHFDHHDVAELAGLNVLGGFLIAGRGAALGADLNDFAGLFDGGEKLAGVGHGVRDGLFDVGIAAGVHGFSAVQGVLEVGGGDDDGVDILARIQLVVVADGVGTVSAELLDKVGAFVAAAAPDV